MTFHEKGLTMRTRSILPALLTMFLAGGIDPQPLAVLPSPLPAGSPPVREVQLASTPRGDLILAVITDAGQADSGRGMFMARHLTSWQLEASGREWRALGGVLNYSRPRPVSNVNLAVDEHGTLVLAWNENYGDADIVEFRAFRDGVWTNWRSRYLGDDLPYAARTHAVAARSGEPVLAWGEYLRKPYGSRLTIREWNGTTWTRGPAFNDVRQFARQPTLALDRAARPVVVWLQGEVLESNLLAKRWTGTAWEALGQRINRRAGVYLSSPRVALDDSDHPVVTWLEDVSGKDMLFVSRWNGQSWSRLGNAVNSRSASSPALALDSQGRPVVAWVEEPGGVGRVHLARWSGEAWQHMGVLNRNAQRDARSPSLAAHPDGAIVLAWREDNHGTYQPELRRFW